MQHMNFDGVNIENTNLRNTNAYITLETTLHNDKTILTNTKDIKCEPMISLISNNNNNIKYIIARDKT